MTKSVVIVLILFLVFFWDYIVLGLVLSWWRLKLKWKSILRLAQEKGSCEKGMWEACDWKLKSRAKLSISRVFHG